MAKKKSFKEQLAVDDSSDTSISIDKSPVVEVEETQKELQVDGKYIINLIYFVIRLAKLKQISAESSSNYDARFPARYLEVNKDLSEARFSNVSTDLVDIKKGEKYPISILRDLEQEFFLTNKYL